MTCFSASDTLAAAMLVSLTYHKTGRIQRNNNFKALAGTSARGFFIKFLHVYQQHGSVITVTLFVSVKVNLSLCLTKAPHHEDVWKIEN
jgi:hypothetical protein